MKWNFSYHYSNSYDKLFNRRTDRLDSFSSLETSTFGAYAYDDCQTELVLDFRAHFSESELALEEWTILSHHYRYQAGVLNPTVSQHPRMPSALKFSLHKKCSTTKARASSLTLPHGSVQLPIFMPVATQASLKGLTPKQLEDTGCMLCLNNTYHLGLKPGQKVLDVIGGAHKLQGWKRNILTGGSFL
nr:queuine trna-ribosyltransferase catalytic subunit [Quercus suber]